MKWIVQFINWLWNNREVIEKDVQNITDKEESHPLPSANVIDINKQIESATKNK